MSAQQNQELEKLREASRAAIDNKGGVRDQIRRITLDALKEGHLEAERIKGVVEAVAEGAVSAVESVGSKIEASKELFAEVLSGIDEALATAAHATQLTIEEARQRVQHFTEQDLAKAKNDLKELEVLFLDTLSELADRSNATARQLLMDLRQHAQDSGTVVGEQLRSAVSDAAGKLQRAGETQITKALDAAFSSGAQLAQAASEVLGNLADSLASAKHDQKKDSTEG